jgi:hypothetical protein
VNFSPSRQRLLRKGGEEFCFLSGQGADPNEKTFTFFGKIKGRTERELSAKYGNGVYLFRPGYIQTMTTGLGLGTAIAAVINRFTEKFGIRVRQLAICMLGVEVAGSDNHLFDNKSIRQFGYYG